MNKGQLVTNVNGFVALRYVFLLALGAPALASGLGACTQVPEPQTPSSAPGSTPTTAGSPAPYPMCGGQVAGKSEGVVATGAVQVQLSPAFLEDMAACAAEDALTPEAIATGDGKINAKGDCELPNGVSCHYHSGVEFISKDTSKQTAGQGEVHCIFPNAADPKSPTVHGAHVVCKNRTEGQVHGAAESHEVKAGASCSAGILAAIRSCGGSRCCDDGTLTGVITDLVKDGRNDLRPDFRICASTLEIDCALLSSYTAHTANSPALGGVGEPVFHAP
jgi:hypothetical protein